MLWLLSFLFLRIILSIIPTFFLLSKLYNSIDFSRKCRYVGNIHTQVTEPLLQEVFASTGPVESCKLIRKERVCCLNNFFMPWITLLLSLHKPSTRLLILWYILFTLLQSSYGFIHYFDRRSASLAILSLNGRHLWVLLCSVFCCYKTEQCL